MVSNNSVLLSFLFLTVLCISQAYQYDYCNAPPQLSVTQTNYTLEFVQLVTRHGDRTTLTQLPGDQHSWQCSNLTVLMSPSRDSLSSVSPGRLFRKNYLPGREPSPGNCFAGELTIKGFEQHLALGQNLRQLYIDTYHFLPSSIDPSLISIRSTDVPRTIASAQGNSLGLYPADPSTGSVPVIDMYTMDTTFENMFPNGGLCPRSNQLLNEVNNEPAYLAHMKSLVPLQQKLSQILNIPLNNLPDWPGLLDAFEVMTCYNQSYPGLDEDTIQQVFAAANWQWNYQLNNTELALLQLGSFATELIANIEAFVKGVEMPKFLVFSGHDTTIGPLLATLQAYDGQWPPYASHMEFELWNNKGEYYVQVKYQGEPLLLSGCSDALCPLSEFMAHVEPIVSVNYGQACLAQ